MDETAPVRAGRSAALLDPVTGLAIHSVFQLSLEREVARRRRNGSSFALALIDLDRFTSYNSTHGHAAGDQLLAVLGREIRRGTRASDLAARYRDDCCAVLLTDSDTERAKTVGERIRSAFADATGATGATEGAAASCSIGLATCPDDDSTSLGLLSAAESALAQARDRGGNRVHFYQSDAQLPAQGTRVLVAESDAACRDLISSALSGQGIQVTAVASGDEVLALLPRHEYDVILLDALAPGTDGYEVLRRLKSDAAHRLVPVVLLTALDDLQARLLGFELGADEVMHKPFQPPELISRVRGLARVRQLTASMAGTRQVLFTFANIVEAKDAYTQGHTERVTTLALELATHLQLPPTDLQALELGAVLHDIGKIAVPSTILNKPGQLDADEWEVMKRHPAVGHQICQPLARVLGGALNVIRHHHEKLDGSGYPDGLSAAAIGVAVRVMTVADMYDATSTDRPYHRGMPVAEVLAFLRQEVASGRLDGAVVTALQEVLASRT